MGIRPTVSKNDGPVQEYIGTAYDVVKEVYDNLPFLRALDADVSSAVDTAQGYRDEAFQFKEDATASAVAAALSEGNAATSETNAYNSMIAAQQAEGNINTIEGNIIGLEADAESSANVAQQAETNALAYETKAQQWAEHPENTEVETGQYSAKHHRLKAEDADESAQLSASSATQSASGANQSKLDAEAAETVATTKAGEALASQQAAASSESNAASSASSASTSANTATTKAAEALSSANNANTSEINAATSETNAGASEAKADLWANAPHGVEVETGKYSSNHWATEAQLSATGGLSYKGEWDASTGTYPTPAEVGDYYKVSVAGTVSSVSYKANDAIIRNPNSGWDHIDNTETVVSVAGKIGAVNLGVLDIVGLQADLDSKLDVSGVAADATKLNNQLPSYYLNWNNTTNTPTTLAGYGITDAASTTGYNKSNWDTAYSWGDWSTGVDKTFVDGLNIDAATLGGVASNNFARTDVAESFLSDVTFNADLELKTNARYIRTTLADGTTKTRSFGINSSNIFYIGSIDKDIGAINLAGGIGKNWLNLNDTSATFQSGIVVNGNGSGLTNVNADSVDGLEASDFALSSHSHAWPEITGKPATATRWPTKAEVGLGNVPNWSSSTFDSRYLGINDTAEKAKTLTGITTSITITGNANTYYPVVISGAGSKTLPTFVSVWKNLGTATNSNYNGNHGNGTSSLWLQYETRRTSWDGNGGYHKTLYKSEPYATLVAETHAPGGSSGDLTVWLRGGGTQYFITTDNPAVNVNVYYTSTQIGSGATVAPRTSIGNRGIYNTAPSGYGSLIGNASSASSVPWSGVTGKPTTFTPSSHSHSINDITKLVEGSTFSGTYPVLTHVSGNRIYSHTSLQFNGSSKTLSIDGNPVWYSGNFDPSSKSDVGHNHSWSSITGKPSSFTPSSHSHDRIERRNVSWNDSYNGMWSSSGPDVSEAGLGGWIDAIHFGHSGGAKYHRALHVRHGDHDNIYYGWNSSTGTWSHHKLWHSGNDSPLVKTSGNQSVGGDKTFTGVTKVMGAGHSPFTVNTANTQDGIVARFEQDGFAESTIRFRNSPSSGGKQHLDVGMGASGQFVVKVPYNNSAGGYDLEVFNGYAKVNGGTVYHTGNDSSLVKTSGNQTISGNKTYTGNILLKAGSHAGAQIFSRDGGANGTNLIISSGGNTVVASGETTAANVGTGTSEDLHLGADGTTYIYSNAQTWGSRRTFTFATNGVLSAVGGFNKTSDERLKDIHGGYDISRTARNIKAVTYTMNGRTQIGYSAQEAEMYLPEAVSKSKTENFDDERSLAYDIVHTAKIAELEVENDELRSRLEALELKMEKLLNG